MLSRYMQLEIKAFLNYEMGNRYIVAYPTRFSAIFTRSEYFRLIRGDVRRPRALG